MSRISKDAEGDFLSSDVLQILPIKDLTTATPIKGALAYNTQDNTVKYSDGLNWLSLSASDPTKIIGIPVTNPIPPATPPDAGIPIFNSGTQSWNVLSLTGDVTMTNQGVTTVLGLRGTPLGPFSSLTPGDSLVWNGSTWTNSSPIPFGAVVIWSGTVNNIPSGWALCDGTNGTPDLLDRFVVGAGSSYPVNSAGGFTDAIVVEHSHALIGNGPAGIATTEGPPHIHTNDLVGTSVLGPRVWNSVVPPPYTQNDTISTGPYPTLTFLDTPRHYVGVMVPGGLHSHNIQGSSNIEGVSGIGKNLPPYYALAYIMKI